MIYSCNRITKYQEGINYGDWKLENNGTDVPVDATASLGG